MNLRSLSVPALPVFVALPAILLMSICFVVAGPFENKQSDDGFQKLFDGKTLEGWDGDSKIFRVEEKTIIGGQLNVSAFAEDAVLIPFFELQDFRQFNFIG